MYLHVFVSHMHLLNELMSFPTLFDDGLFAFALTRIPKKKRKKGAGDLQRMILDGPLAVVQKTALHRSAAAHEYAHCPRTHTHIKVLLVGFSHKHVGKKLKKSAKFKTKDCI